MQFMEKMRPLALLLLRIGVGVVFMANGYPKFWGRRLEHIDEFVHVAQLPAYFVYIAGALELGGGGLLVVGLFTRILGLLLAGEMAVGLWRDEKMFQYPLRIESYGLALVLGVAAFALATFGPGPFSLGPVVFWQGKGLALGKVRRLSEDFAAGESIARTCPPEKKAGRYKNSASIEVLGDWEIHDEHSICRCVVDHDERAPRGARKRERVRREGPHRGGGRAAGSRAALCDG